MNKCEREKIIHNLCIATHKHINRVSFYHGIEKFHEKKKRLFSHWTEMISKKIHHVQQWIVNKIYFGSFFLSFFSKMIKIRLIMWDFSITRTWWFFIALALSEYVSQRIQNSKMWSFFQSHENAWVKEKHFFF